MGIYKVISNFKNKQITKFLILARNKTQQPKLFCTPYKIAPFTVFRP